MSNNNQYVITNYFVSNLNQIISIKKLPSIKHAANYFGIKERRLKSWIYYQRVPTLYTLDKVANHLNIQTYKLIKKNPVFEFKQNIKNDSSKVFSTNLRKLLNQYDIKTADEFYDYCNYKISKSTYYSYFKSKYFKLPSLFTIETIANIFYIEPYKLIKKRSD